MSWRGFDAAQRAWDNATPPDDECCDPSDGCVQCNACRGDGIVDGVPCAACDGDGRVVCCGYSDDYDGDGPDDDYPCEMECDYGDTKY